jgi:hypothetical protein
VSMPFRREHLFSTLLFKNRGLWLAINGIPRFYNSFMLSVGHRVHKTGSLDLRYLAVGQIAASSRNRESFPIIVYYSSVEKTTVNLLTTLSPGAELNFCAFTPWMDVLKCSYNSQAFVLYVPHCNATE